ncbi:MAG TPA: PQQ-binding-like beta-propeller repeat protein, partial [Acidobacteriota bacterium]|nr:PQQ-binding-like beta-propeller repeat protein [Acidobacteriota bacterium]
MLLTRMYALRKFSLITICILFSSVLLASENAEDWPRWRGANFDGVSSPASHPFSHPFELRIRWKRKLGTGYSGVVVSKGQAVTMFSDGKTDYLIALSADEGDLLWHLPLGETFPPRDGSSGGPVSTPAIDRNVVYALGPRGQLVAVDLSDGKLLWKRDVVAELGASTPHWGFTTSP